MSRFPDVEMQFWCVLVIALPVYCRLVVGGVFAGVDVVVVYFSLHCVILFLFR